MSSRPYRTNSSYRGINKLRRTLRRLEAETVAEVRTTLVDIVEAVQWGAVELAPERYGDLRASIDYKLSRDGLSAVVGPGARAVEFMRSKGTNIFSRRADIKISDARSYEIFQATKGYWLEFGTKQMTKRPFMQPAWDRTAKWAKDRMRKAIKNALWEASS